jgi:hypothetical protein
MFKINRQILLINYKGDLPREVRLCCCNVRIDTQLQRVLFPVGLEQRRTRVSTASQRNYSRVRSSNSHLFF